MTAIDELEDYTVASNDEGATLITFNRLVYYKGVEVSSPLYGRMKMDFTGFEYGIIMAGATLTIKLKVIRFPLFTPNGFFKQEPVPAIECTFKPIYELI